jgi:hypothetical protein
MPSGKFIATVAVIAILAVMGWNKFLAPKTGVAA